MRYEVFIYDDPYVYQKELPELQNGGWRIVHVSTVVRAGTLLWVATAVRDDAVAQTQLNESIKH